MKIVENTVNLVLLSVTSIKVRSHQTCINILQTAYMPERTYVRIAQKEKEKKKRKDSISRDTEFESA